MKWRQLDHIQIIWTSPQTDNIDIQIFFTGLVLFLMPKNSVKALKAATTCWPSLVWCAWAHQVQTVYYDVPMPGQHYSTVSGGTLVTSLWDRITTASSFGCQPSTDSAATSADHIMAVGRLLSLVCRCGTRCQNVSMIPLLVLLLLAVFSKHFLFSKY